MCSWRMCRMTCWKGGGRTVDTKGLIDDYGREEKGLTGKGRIDDDGQHGSG